MFLAVFYIFLQITLVHADEKIITSTESGNQVCDIDSSCNTTTITTAVAETETDKTNLTDKWKYNVTETNSANDTIINIFHLNDTSISNNNISDSSNQHNNQSSANVENKSTNTKYQINYSEDCECDVTRGSCDMNCCCDRDCSHVNRDVFKNCVGVKSAEDDKYCPTKILNSPLLCVVKDNLYSRHFYPHHRIAEEPSNVDKLLRNREAYSWSFPIAPPEEPEIDQSFEPYELSSPVWIHDGESVQFFQLPKSTIMSRDCSHKGIMKYLEDFEETCTHRVTNVSASDCSNNLSIFNAANYFQNFSFVSNPVLMNTTSNCSQHNCINVTTFICETDDSLTCLKINSSTKLTSYSSSSKICQQAVSSVHYAIHHNGTEGITSVFLYLQLGDIVFKENLLWALSFKLSYHWAGQGHSFQLSGYPGYVLERPIITGYKVYQALKDNKTMESMKMSYNRHDWLTVFRTNSDGSCLKLQRENIKFRENLYTHCFLDVPVSRTMESCEALQNEIYDIIFGLSINLSNVYISTTGDPDTTDKKKWAPILLDLPSNILNDSCHGLVTAMKMVILHSIVGDYDDPQQIIMGVKVSGKSSHRSILKTNKIKISFSVNFHDVTNSPLRIFAEPPTYEIKLPTDFFYPFFSSAMAVPKMSIILGSVLAFVLFYTR
ncbi:tectonic-3 [Planococcus citri]|uniref:tectonic-3 n=1 Tax=Planococcus citri TaxID=170843 RepID=UPI0031F9D399